MAIHILSAENLDKIIRNSERVIVKYSGSFCGPCRQIQPYFEKLAHNYAGQVVFLVVDVNEVPNSPYVAKIRSLPTFHTYRKGQPIGEVKGSSEPHLKALVENLFKNSKKGESK